MNSNQNKRELTYNEAKELVKQMYQNHDFNIEFGEENDNKITSEMQKESNVKIK